MKALIISIIFLMTSSGSCESSPPFQYQDNSRIVIIGILINADGTVLKNQSSELYTYRDSQKIFVNRVYSDNEGKIFITAPTANYQYYLEFYNKRIASTTYHSDLMVEDLINTPLFYGYLTNFKGTNFDFGFIKLINYN